MGRHKCKVECFSPNILDTIRCVSSLDCLVDDVLSCMCSKPSPRRIQEILTCVVLNEVSLLSNATFGLNEIKSEIRFIENEVTVINNSISSLLGIENEIALIDNGVRLINNSINSPVFGLREINNGVNFIENEVRFLDFEARLINNSVNSPVFGLKEINDQVLFIENEVRFIENEVKLINNSINSPIFGLREIKNEIRFIENEVRLINNSINNPACDCREFDTQVVFIENEVKLINDSVNSPVFGLNQISNGIRMIDEVSQHASPSVTSGPVFTDEDARRLTVKVLNSTDTDHTVRVRVYDLDQSPSYKIFDKFLEVKAFESDQFTNIRLTEESDDQTCSSCDLDNDNFEDEYESNRIRAFEIVITRMEAGLYPAAVQTRKNRPIESTFIKSADFIPKNGNFEV